MCLTAPTLTALREKQIPHSPYTAHTIDICLILHHKYSIGNNDSSETP